MGLLYLPFTYITFCNQAPKYTLWAHIWQPLERRFTANSVLAIAVNSYTHPPFDTAQVFIVHLAVL